MAAQQAHERLNVALTEWLGKPLPGSLTDPAVGWPLWARWAQATGFACYLLWNDACRRWECLLLARGHDGPGGSGATPLDALLDAWAQALGVPAPHTAFAIGDWVAEVQRGPRHSPRWGPVRGFTPTGRLRVGWRGVFCPPGSKPLAWRVGERPSTVVPASVRHLTPDEQTLAIAAAQARDYAPPTGSAMSPDAIGSTVRT